MDPTKDTAVSGQQELGLEEAAKQWGVSTTQLQGFIADGSVSPIYREGKVLIPAAQENRVRELAGQLVGAGSTTATEGRANHRET